MRRSEVTKELIDLSKRAKELGFPQDVEEGDWVLLLGQSELWSQHYRIGLGGKIGGDAFLILSFSRAQQFLGKDISKLHEDAARRVIEKLQK
jgi:hypothetical protein